MIENNGGLWIGTDPVDAKAEQNLRVFPAGKNQFHEVTPPPAERRLGLETRAMRRHPLPNADFNHIDDRVCDGVRVLEFQPRRS
ncbi:hypothetical protein [Agrilutibacter solisilvae]|uniref:Uncharacterized protein n=1 Tax=Agrilutibacter solisilvae TaxID=2763317 RepID=A0A974Y2B7_9GAMM|nr:hypothetical protein [Lysobacter solisilvae]QSX80136.1 hypothetical protein I8J32_016945 [Lysobacter solisilvae]